MKGELDMMIKDFNTPEECRQVALAIANARHLQIGYEFYMDNLLSLKTAAKEKLEDGTLVPIHCYDNYSFGLAPLDKRKIAGQAEWDNQLVFYAKSKGVSILYKFKFVPSKKPVEVKTAVLDSKDKLYAYLKAVIKDTDLGVVKASIIHQEAKSIVYYANLALLPNTAFQVKSSDKERATSKLELNFYMPLEEAYLNLKLSHIKLAAHG